MLLGWPNATIDGQFLGLCRVFGFGLFRFWGSGQDRAEKRNAQLPRRRSRKIGVALGANRMPAINPKP